MSNKLLIAVVCSIVLTCWADANAQPADGSISTRACFGRVSKRCYIFSAERNSGVRYEIARAHKGRLIQQTQLSEQQFTRLINLVSKMSASSIQNRGACQNLVEIESFKTSELEDVNTVCIPPALFNSAEEEMQNAIK